MQLSITDRAATLHCSAAVMLSYCYINLNTHNMLLSAMQNIEAAACVRQPLLGQLGISAGDFLSENPSKRLLITFSAHQTMQATTFGHN